MTAIWAWVRDLHLRTEAKQASSVKLMLMTPVQIFFRVYKICLLKTGMFYIELLSDV